MLRTALLAALPLAAVAFLTGCSSSPDTAAGHVSAMHQAPPSTSAPTPAQSHRPGAVAASTLHSAAQPAPTPTAAQPATPAPTQAAPPTSSTATISDILRTLGLQRCQAFTAQFASHPGTCEFLGHTAVSSVDPHFGYAQVVTVGHEGTIFRRATPDSTSFTAVFEVADQPQPCSAVTAAGVPVTVYAEFLGGPCLSG